MTDLQLANLTGDPLYERNFKGILHDAGDRSLVLDFDADAALLAASAQWLVFDSVKMGAWVWLNGVYLGAVQDQFLRFRFDVGAVLKPTGNTLSVTFPPSNDTINDQARWMGCSGAWDWAFYSSSFSSRSSHTFSKGIVRSVYLVGVPAGGAALEHLQPRVYYRGAYPTAPLSDASAGAWTVVARVHLLAPAATSGVVAVAGSWGGSASVPASLALGSSAIEVTLEVPAQTVRLWWPNEMGAQALYNLSASFTPAAGSGAPAVAVSRRLGFRFVALVTANDTDPSTIDGVDGSGSFTMRLNVNGAKIWSRGANQIPMEEMEGRQSAAAYVSMLRSAQAAHMNTLRVWGGGVFLPDVFYDTADELGLLMCA